MALMLSTNGPIDGNGRPLPIDAIPDMKFYVEDPNHHDDDKNLLLTRTIAKMHTRGLREKYGAKVKEYPDELLQKRALSKETDADEPGSGGFVYETLPEQCEMLGLDVEEVHKRNGLQTRGLDGGTDTTMVAVDYAAEWLRELRAAGRLLPLFSRQMDIPMGKATWSGTILGPAQFLKQGAVTTDTVSSNTAVDPTSSAVTLTPWKNMAIIYFSGELTEEAIAPLVEGLRVSFVEGAGIAIDHIILSGDTLTTTANINSYASAGANNGLASGDPRLCRNGLRALDYKSTVDKSASVFSGVDMSNTVVTLDDITAGLSALGKWGEDPEKVLTLISLKGHYQALQDAKARPDTYSALLDASKGKLLSVSGSPIVRLANSVVTNAGTSTVPTYSLWNSEGYPINLNASGVYDASTTNRSGFTQVRQDNIIFGWKRRLEIKVIDLPLTDQGAIVAFYRFDFVPIITGRGIVTSFNASIA